MQSRRSHWRLLGAGLWASALIAMPSALAQRPAPSGLTGPGVEYINGGVSSEEADQLRAQAANYPLQIQFTRANAFVASVGVRIFDARGNTVLALPAADPILLADLPPGRYTVEAIYEGRMKRQEVTIGRGHHKLGFQW
jgi:hypothetical protein